MNKTYNSCINHAIMISLAKCQGFEKPQSDPKDWLYYQNHTPHIDILLFQKHKLKGENTELLGQQL